MVLAREEKANGEGSERGIKRGTEGGTERGIKRGTEGGTEEPLARKVKTLESCGLFGGLPRVQINKLAGMAISQKHPKGQTIFAQGDKAKGFYLVATGLAKIYLLDPNGRERILHLCGPGTVFGAAAVFKPGGYPASAEAVKTTETLLLPSQGLRDMMAENPDFSLTLFGLFAQKLIELKELIEMESQRPARKLAGYLLGLPTDGLVPPGGHEGVNLPIAKAKLALHLGMTPESLSRAFGKLKAAGLVKEHKLGPIKIKRTELAQMVRGEADL
jgi:CRP/FNR family transcriptional regulator